MSNMTQEAEEQIRIYVTIMGSCSNLNDAIKIKIWKKQYSLTPSASQGNSAPSAPARQKKVSK